MVLYRMLLQCVGINVGTNALSEGLHIHVGYSTFDHIKKIVKFAEALSQSFKLRHSGSLGIQEIARPYNPLLYLIFN